MLDINNDYFRGDESKDVESVASDKFADIVIDAWQGAAVSSGKSQEEIRANEDAFYGSSFAADSGLGLEERLAAASHHKTAGKDLIDLADDDDKPVRDAAFANINMDRATLHALANSLKGDVRYKVAMHPSTSPEDLLKLATDGYKDVKFVVALNQKTPPEALLLIAQFKDLGSKEGIAVAMHHNTPAEALSQLALHKDLEVLMEVAKAFNTSGETLALLASHKDREVRLRAAGNQTLPLEELRLLAGDQDPQVCAVAQQRLSQRSRKR